MPMGITFQDKEYQGGLPAIPPEVLLQQSEVTSQLQLDDLDAQILFWEKMYAQSRNAVERATAIGNLNSLQTMRLMHGLPLLEVV